MNVCNVESVVGAVLLAASLGAHAANPDVSGTRLERIGADADPAIGLYGKPDGGDHSEDLHLPGAGRRVTWGVTTQFSSNDRIASIGEWDRDRPGVFDRSLVAFGFRIAF